MKTKCLHLEEKNLRADRLQFYLMYTTYFLFIYLSIYLFIYLWLHWVFVVAHRLFSSCGERGLLFITVLGLLTAVASLVAEYGL